jgi:7-cyano-7-deazaguanine synthase
VQSNHQIIRSPDYQMSTAVLLSGGVDSAVLLAEEAARNQVQPIYVAVGLAWEARERAAVARLLTHAVFGRVGALVTLTVDMRDVYPAAHWALKGSPPAYDTPDEDVYLPGRNIVLLGKAGVYCAAVGIGRLVLGTLGHNPFPDATPEFRAAMAQALSLGLAHDLDIAAPYASLDKSEIIRRGAALGVPLELTMSCMNTLPQHCGVCSKCRERHNAFVDAQVPDPTEYADMSCITSGHRVIGSSGHRVIR